MAPVVSDSTQSLSPAEQRKLRRRIARIQQRFPQVILQVVVHHFPLEHPFSMHVFWLFNAGNFAGGSTRGKDNRALMIALDPNRSESAIIPGYGLESLLKTEALDHLLELAGPAWENKRWADGIFRVLDGLDQLLESVALPDVASIEGGEF
ncbi:MAG: TPM domain-containing protein [Luteolibacter sp.]